MGFLQKWFPKFFSNSIDSPGQYDYSPSIAGQYISWTVGVGTDALAGGKIDGTLKWPLFTIPDKLVADPCLIKVDNVWWRAFTVGEPNGKRNGIGVHKIDVNGKVLSPVRMVIPQSANPSSYGNGQATLTTLPNGFIMMMFRVDGDFNRTVILDRSMNYVKDVPFFGAEDGPSPDIFWYEGKVWKLVQGGGLVGLRSFQYVDDRLVRDVGLESGFPVPEGDGVLWARNVVRFSSPIDGCGVERTESGGIRFVGFRKLAFWNGSGDPTNPGSWLLRKGTITIPK
jgi:hypothetical protein